MTEKITGKPPNPTEIRLKNINRKIDDFLEHHTISDPLTKELKILLEDRSQIDGNSPATISWWEQLMDGDPELAVLSWKAICRKDKQKAILLTSKLFEALNRRPVTEPFFQIIAAIINKETVNVENIALKNSWKQVVSEISAGQYEDLIAAFRLIEPEESEEIVAEIDEHRRFSKSSNPNWKNKEQDDEIEEKSTVDSPPTVN